MHKLIEASVFAAIGVLVFASLLIPVVDQATATTDTFTNDGYFRLDKITSTEEHVITWDYENPYVFIVDDENVTIPFGSTNDPIYPYSIISAENWALRFISTSNGVRIDLAVFGQQNSLIWGTSTVDEKNATFTFNNGVATIARADGATTTQTYDYAFIPSNDGAYCMKKGNVDAFVNKDSEIFATGRTGAVFNGNTVNLNLNVKADIENGATVNIVYPTDGYTISNETVNNVVVSSYLNLYKFTNVTFTVTDVDEYAYNAVYGQVIIPYSVTAEKAIHADEPTRDILAILPLILICALIMGIVGVAVYQRIE